MMKTTNKSRFKIIEAEHMGMCFGVKAAIHKAQQLAEQSPVTILGELAHNPSVKQSLSDRGAYRAELTDKSAPTNQVVITAHGAADKERIKWRNRGYRVNDTTCPLVHKAHAALSLLVSKGYTPLVIGKADHVEVRGLTGDFPHAQVIQSKSEICHLKVKNNKLGIISQTTQQMSHVDELVTAIKQHFTQVDVSFIDTICHPTKNRQSALKTLCSRAEVIIVVGGKNSNNTAQLTSKCRDLGRTAYHVQRPHDIDPAWLKSSRIVGLTAGTSTPDEDIQAIKNHLYLLSSTK